MTGVAQSPVKTPCIGVCSTGIGDTVCRGCKRFSHEVINWNSYTEHQKHLIDSRLSVFLSQCVRNKLIVSDRVLLERQLQVQQIAYTPSHDEYCWAYSMIKSGASQIDAPENYGFRVLSEYADMSLVLLRNIIDADFFALSQAHYDRYVLAPGMFRGT